MTLTGAYHVPRRKLTTHHKALSSFPSLSLGVARSERTSHCQHAHIYDCVHCTMRRARSCRQATISTQLPISSARHSSVSLVCTLAGTDVPLSITCATATSALAMSSPSGRTMTWPECVRTRALTPDSSCLAAHSSRTLASALDTVAYRTMCQQGREYSHRPRSPAARAAVQTPPPLAPSTRPRPATHCVQVTLPPCLSGPHIPFRNRHITQQGSRVLSLIVLSHRPRAANNNTAR